MECSCRGDQIYRRPPGGGGYCVCACSNAVPSAGNDPLLLALAARLLQSPPPRHYQFFAEEIHGFQSPSLQSARQKSDFHHRQELPQQQTQSLIRSLLRRIAALEAMISSTPAADPSLEVPRSTVGSRKVSPRRRPPPRRALLRDLAARTIQAAFRRYLVRRSRSLRDLKLLASVRSRLAVLRLSVSEEARISPKLLHIEAADLLRRLDSIQSADAMILELKAPIGRELEELLVFSESLLLQKAVEEIDIDRRTSGRGRERERVEDLHDLLETPHGEAEESDDGSPNYDRDAIGSLASSVPLQSIIEEERRRILEEGSPFGRYGDIGDESLLRKQMKARISHGKPSLGRPSSPGLSAPLPLQMEPRRGDMKKTGLVIS
ncbi:calmodulin-binding protein-like protein [Wolffia australiana]